MAQVGPPVETVVSSLRHALIADRGRVFLSGDYAKIQACIVLALAGQHDKAALMVDPTDEIFAITSAGGVIRTRAAEVKQSGRQTMGVRLMNLATGDSVVALARNAESLAEGDQEPPEEEGGQELEEGEADQS